MIKKAVVFVGVLVLTALFCAVGALAAATAAPDPNDITVANNLTGSLDTVVVDNINNNDIVRVYSAPAGGTPIGAAAASGTSATVYIAQLGTGSGSVYVSVTTSGSTESSRTLQSYSAESKTTAPDPDDITVSNYMAGTLDVITVPGVASGDVVRAYQKSTGPVILASTISGGTTATLYVNQLGIASGAVYITVQKSGEIESNRVTVAYESELSAALPENAVTVINNFYTESGGSQVPASRDTITVTGLTAGDKVMVYMGASGTASWAGPVTVAGDPEIIYVPQLGTTAGKLYVTVTKTGKAESKRTAYTIPAEDVTPPLTSGKATIDNNYNAPDDVTVTGLTEGDVIKVYSAQTGGVQWGSGTVSTGNTAVQFTIPLNNLLAAGGTAYVSVTSTGANESSRVPVKYGAEDVTTAPAKTDIEVANNFGPNNDSVTVSNLTIGDTIKIYSMSKGDTQINTDVVADAASETIPLNANALLKTGGTIYVTLTSSSAGESTRTAVAYSAEAVATAPTAGSITVTNNYGTPDTVVVNGLAAGDVIKVYSALTGGELWGTGTESTGSATASIDDGKLKATGGKLYVSVTKTAENESTRTTVTYGIEPTTDPLTLNNVDVINKYGAQDEIIIKNLTVGDIVTVYKLPTTTSKLVPSVTATAATVTITLEPGLLSTAVGKIYVTVQKSGMNESARLAVSYSAEKTVAPLASTVTVKNNYVGTDDTIKITGVALNDIISIYKTSGGTDYWVDHLTVDNGNLSGSSVTISISQLGQAAGKIYVTLTKEYKAESARTPVSYISEPPSTAPAEANITIENNFNADDTVVVKNLNDQQTVLLYSSDKGTTPLATLVASGANATVTFTLEDGVLSAAGSKLYVAVKDTDKLESPRTPKAYTSEITAAPLTSNILVVNLAGTAYDTVTLVGLTVGDTVTVYSTQTGGPPPLASETVTGKGTIITFSLDTNLPDTAGKIYITVTSAGKAESKRVAVSYQAA